MGQPILKIEGLTKSFGRLVAVKEVDLTVQPGELKSIIGPNGAGKTTLFNLVTGRLTPDRGRALFRGEEITGLRPHEIMTRGMARSFQITNIFPNLTVFENVRLAVQRRVLGGPGGLLRWRRAGEIGQRTAEILERTGLAPHRDQPAGTISYGDQRHLEIAICLGTEPALLLLDEPTAGMSPAETQATIALIQALAGSVTILLIEHDMDVVMRVSDSIFVMHFGERLAEGDPDTIRKDPRVQEAYLGRVE
ncbi:MAG: ABC transporter ATP-binding protein [Deltaproteobacteria bacterium]|nr:ABC transporter ATP-binding protein [Deltaproteobacteria bacterium]